MKRIFSMILALMIGCSLCACQGNFGQMELQDRTIIPENGVITRQVLQQLRDKNAIGVFEGVSQGISYEWTIFGSDITEIRDVNLSVHLWKSDDGGIHLQLNQEAGFGFSALLSIHLQEKWKEQSATAYKAQQAIASVSITGSKSSILNVMLDGRVTDLLILPDALLGDALVEDPRPDISLEAPTQPNNPPSYESDDYLTGSIGGNGDVYTDGNTAASTQPTQPNQPTAPQAGSDDYLSAGKENDEQVYHDGKDKYFTDPVPAGRPNPVEPEDQNVNTGSSLTCTFSIECSTILNNLDMLDPEKLEMVPSNGVILETVTVTFYEGESVFDVLQRICKEYGIHMEAEWTPIYNSAYVEGIHNLYEFDCGALSGWMYSVNDWYPNYGCSRYRLKEGDVVQWRYTCDLGNDVGGGYAVGG